jgi:hypothetical protein
MFAILEPTTFPLFRIVLSVLCVIAGHVSIARAQSSGTFTATGSMVVPGIENSPIYINVSTEYQDVGRSV